MLVAVRYTGRPLAQLNAAAVWSESEFIYRHNTINSPSSDSIFGINLPFEETVTQIKIFKSRYRNRVTDDHSKHCLYLSVSNYEPSRSKLSYDMVSCIDFARGKLMKDIRYTGRPLTQSNYTRRCINTIVLLRMSTRLLETCRGFK